MAARQYHHGSAKIEGPAAGKNTSGGVSLCFGQCKQEPRLVGGHSSTWTWYTSGQTTAINWHDAINRQLATVHQSSLGRRWLMNGNKGLQLQCDDSSLYQSICKFQSTFMVHSGVNLLIFRADPSSRYSGALGSRMNGARPGVTVPKYTNFPLVAAKLFKWQN